jgi:hypothetical protein
MSNVNNTVFVFHKDGVIKVFDLETLKSLEDQSLLSQGWQHTATLNPCVFIEYLANNKEYVDIINSIKKLSVVGG